MNLRTLIVSAAAVWLCSSALAAGETIRASAAKADPIAEKAEQLFLGSFDPNQPRYWLDRLKQDEAMRLCSHYRDQPPPAVRAAIEKSQRETIRYPVDGKLIGDWAEGEKLASSGRGGHIGTIQPDPAGTPRGGNCYACHELAPKEIAYGTIGPSLRQFGRRRGYTDEMVRYVYERIYNSNAFSACTNMPRFGYHQWLTPEQITHIVAFLMDPESPVNKE